LDWDALAKFFLGGAFISGVLAYVGKRAVDAFFNSRTEIHKSELQRITTEHAIRFQKLHSERGEVIKELYAKLAVLDDQLHSTLRFLQIEGEPPLDEKVSKLQNQFNGLREYFSPRRIFFAEDVCRLVEEILDVARNIFLQVTTHRVDPKHPEYQHNRDLLKERHEFWEAARSAYKNQFTELRAKLEVEFRALLGINT
jgi:hypothetical protein